MYEYALMHMSDGSLKKRVTLTIDEQVYEEAQRVVQEKGTTISAVVQNFLKFYNDPKVYCFNCGKRFSSSEAELCPLCGWMKCPECGYCRCDISDEVAKALFYMREVFEDLVSGSVKQA